ncbi:MAG: HD domain-containing protein [Clostridia bacterium]|nr:HD domain-containing protein [Clostridia bacterium]
MSTKYNEIINNEEIKTYIRMADESLLALGYTEHSFTHVGKVSHDSEYILRTLGYSEHEIELVKIAAYLHDIGNLANRIDHSQTGAVMAFRILDHMNMPPEDIATIVSAIGNHDEGTGVPVNAISAALIIADKADVRRSRVRNRDVATFDIHDRVNYSVEKSQISIDKDAKTIKLTLKIDTGISPIMDYFEIFLNRMLLCRKAAEKLGLKFILEINDQQLL